ncbi:unnamed protein product [Rotaria sordida]|uniref:Uncharacterized protein n=1 Tax=Rotaria sordida TaxID=392033 RepID=A0A813NI38_9BILA|nr:unnamed protein product [Rotaria sordida]CAF0801591.1 unnamed protein product [Rotaria sordida]
MRTSIGIFTLMLYVRFISISHQTVYVHSYSMGCTSAKANKVESDLERYHQEIFGVVQTGDVKRLKDILDELDRRKASTTKKEVLNMGM